MGTSLADLLRHASPDVIGLNSEQLSAAVSGGSDKDGPTEADEQEAIVTWALAHEAQWPALQLLYHPANGEYRPDSTGAKLKRMGVKAGIPDLHLPVPAYGYHSLYIELKRDGRQREKNGGLTDAQVEMILRLRRYGNYVRVCYGQAEAIDTLVWWIGGEVVDQRTES